MLTGLGALEAKECDHSWRWCGHWYHDHWHPGSMRHRAILLKPIGLINFRKPNSYFISQWCCNLVDTVAWHHSCSPPLIISKNIWANNEIRWNCTPYRYPVSVQWSLMELGRVFFWPSFVQSQNSLGESKLHQINVNNIIMTHFS
jgi:hypothetical protein